MLGLQLLVVGASARFFVPAGGPAPAVQAPVLSGSTALLPVVSAPRFAPIVAIAPAVDERMLTLSFYSGLVAGVSVLLLGVTSASKAFRRKERAQVRPSPVP